MKKKEEKSYNFKIYVYEQRRSQISKENQLLWIDFLIYGFEMQLALFQEISYNSTTQEREWLCERERESM